VIAQRLIRKICPKCSIDHKVPSEVLLKLGVATSEIDQYSKLKKGEGCDDCGGTGLRGRMAIFEVLRMGNNIKEAIYKEASPIEIKREAMKGGMRTLRQAALLKLKAGVTIIEEVINTTVADDVI
jgi:type IV pilus assembly protein PilB